MKRSANETSSAQKYHRRRYGPAPADQPLVESGAWPLDRMRLPRGVWPLVWAHCQLDDLVRCARVCSHWRRMLLETRDQSIWGTSLVDGRWVEYYLCFAARNCTDTIVVTMPRKTEFWQYPYTPYSPQTDCLMLSPTQKRVMILDCQNTLEKCCEASQQRWTTVEAARTEFKSRRHTYMYRTYMRDLTRSKVSTLRMYMNDELHTIYTKNTYHANPFMNVFAHYVSNGMHTLSIDFCTATVENWANQHALPRPLSLEKHTRRCENVLYELCRRNVFRCANPNTWPANIPQLRPPTTMQVVRTIVVAALVDACVRLSLGDVLDSMHPKTLELRQIVVEASRHLQ